MTTLLQRPASESPKYRHPELRGIYYLKDVSRLLRATDYGVHGDKLSMSSQQLAGWSARGLAEVQTDPMLGRHRFVRFPDLITLRLVAILRSYGIRIEKIVDAHTYLQEALLTAKPFVNRALWVDDSDTPREIYAEVDSLLVTASRHGQLSFTKLRATKIVAVVAMKFDQEGDAANWTPSEGVVIDPKIRSGAPCMEGTGIATYIIWGLHEAGETVPTIADWYELNPGQVENAVKWEEMH